VFGSPTATIEFVGNTGNTSLNSDRSKAIEEQGRKSNVGISTHQNWPLKQSELEEADRIGVELKFRARCLAEEKEVGALSAGSMPEGVWNR